MPTQTVSIKVAGEFETFRFAKPYDRISIVSASGVVSIKDANNNINEGIVAGGYIDYKGKQHMGLVGITSTVAETVIVHYGDNELLVNPTVFVTNPASSPVVVQPRPLPILPNTASIGVPAELTTDGKDFQSAVLNISGGPEDSTVRINGMDTQGVPYEPYAGAYSLPMFNFEGDLLNEHGTDIDVPAEAYVTVIVPVLGSQQINVGVTAGGSVSIQGQFTNGRL
ncbi:MAG: hypothetical protein ACREL1_00385 [bacterium]